MKHTSLDNARRYIPKHGIDLFPRELGGDMMNLIDTHGILRRQRRRGRHGIAAMSCDDFLVCF